MSKHILILAGDGIGPEIVGAAEKVLTTVNQRFNLGLTWEQGLLGGAAIDAHGEPYPAVTSEQAKNADAILLGEVGSEVGALEIGHGPMLAGGGGGRVSRRGW